MRIDSKYKKTYKLALIIIAILILKFFAQFGVYDFPLFVIINILLIPIYSIYIVVILIYKIAVKEISKIDFMNAVIFGIGVYISVFILNVEFTRKIDYSLNATKMEKIVEYVKSTNIEEADFVQYEIPDSLKLWPSFAKSNHIRILAKKDTLLTIQFLLSGTPTGHSLSFIYTNQDSLKTKYIKGGKNCFYCKSLPENWFYVYE